MSEENVKVAVRVRPFNKRERERNATCIISMNGPTTVITDPSDKDEKKFSFDYSYWSHDGSKEGADGYYGPDSSHPNGKKFADQKRVFDDLGIGVLNNAWEGYNSTLFAYGQTGSGKSWSIVGYGVNKGVVPLFCEKMFQGIDEKKAAGDETEYEVIFSMLEIYNEQVRDLLDSRPKKAKLHVRQHPKSGFYADGLKVVPVNSYEEIEQKMEDGTRNRTVAATNMNATSSRAHTIVGITLVQKFRNAAGEDTTKSAVINLVDLAGSERAESTGATGDRLKEGAAINQSLSCLGNCIAALAEKSGGKNVRVPYRDSVLTKLLKNALAGNSKTIMIAAVSPADINYDESLSTLRYADRAKQIKTVATVNEDPTEKLIRELQEENEKLKAALAGNPNAFAKTGDDDDDDDDGMTDEERQKEYESVMAENARQMEEMKKSFEEKLKLAREQTGGGDNLAEIAEKKKTIPHLYNLNPDPQLTGHIVSFLDTPRKTIGKKDDNDLVVKGPKIGDLHAVITEEGGAISIEPSSFEFKTVRNGNVIGNKTELKHNDRLRFGSTMYFVYVNPKQRDEAKEPWPVVDYEMAQEEAATKWGFDMDSANKTRDDALLKEDMLELMPSVEEANSISEELDKKMKFELMVVSPEARGLLKGRTEVMIKVVNLETKHEWVWPREKFLNRKFLMQEMYENFQEGEEWDVPVDQKERDPFVDDYEAEFHIGSVKLWLQSLAYLIDINEQLEITDFKGQDVGLLNVEVLPCDKKGKPLAEADAYVEKPEELLGKEISFTVEINSARGLPARFTDVYAKFTVYMEEEFNCTTVVKGTSNPDFKFKKQFNFKCDEAFLTYLNESAIMVQIWGKQKPPKTKKSVNTAQAMMAQTLRKGQVAAANDNTKKFDAEKVKYMMEVAMLKKRQQMMELKMNSMKRMLEMAEEHKKKKLSTKLIRDIYHAQTADSADKCLKLIPQEKDDDDDDEPDAKKSTTEGTKEVKKPDSPRSKSRASSKSSKSSKSSNSEHKKSSTCVLL